MQILEATKYAGKTIRIRAAVDFFGKGNTCDLWASLDDIGDRSIEFHESRMESASEQQETSIVLEIPRDAAKFKYGLTFRGPGSVWVNSLDIEVLGESELDMNRSGRFSEAPLDEALDALGLSVLKF